MKSQRRHELQQNVLDTELSKIIGFLKRRGNAIAWGVLIVALVVFAVVGISNWRTGKAEGLQAKYDKLMSDPSVPAGERREGLRSIASQEDNKQLAAMASVRLADDYIAELLSGNEKLTVAQSKGLADQASACYNETISKFPDRTLEVAKAHLGLGKLAESRGDFDLAKKEYQAVVSLPGLTGQPIVELAENAMANLAQLRTPVIMAATAPAEEDTSRKAPASQSTSAPTSGPASAPASKPVAKEPAKAAPTASKAKPAPTTRPVVGKP